MTLFARNIKDRIAVGDDLFDVVELPDGRIRLIPAPDEVIEPGTDINKGLLQPLEDRTVFFLNTFFDDITSNPFNISFGDLEGLTITGIWNEEEQRIEC